MWTARRQRRTMSPPEVKLWALLRCSPDGIKFRRQHPIEPYVADFYCATAKMVIEIDGLVHDFEDASLRDQRRDKYIESLGLNVIRIPAAEVLRDPGAVANAMLAMCSGSIGPSTT